MHYQSLLLSLSVTVHSLTYLLSVARRQIGPTLARALPSPRLHYATWERKTHLPLHIWTFLPSTSLQDCFAHFRRTVAAWPKKLRKYVPRPIVLPNWNCALCNDNSQQPDRSAHCTLPVVSQSPSSPGYALSNLGSWSPDLPIEIAQPSSSFTQVCYKLVLMFILVFD